MPNYSGVWTLQQQLQAKAANNWTAPPGAPTIGTATATSSTTASVTFSAPSDSGIPATITGYTVTSSPGGLTGTGASSPITVSGLTTGTAYTFTVRATNASGTGPASAASNSVTPVLAIGDAYQGGFYAGQISTTGNGIANFNLVVASLSSGQFGPTQYKNTSTATTGADSVIDGPQNTADMVADGSSTVYPAAHFCNDLVTGGYSDWYMPAKNELEVCYYNLKPTTQINSTDSGANSYAVPSRGSNYTAGTPSLTSAADFQSPSAQAFATARYWSSTESSTIAAFNQTFYTGAQYSGSGKSGYARVRAIRRVAV